jgi:hypothetical protein
MPCKPEAGDAVRLDTRRGCNPTTRQHGSDPAQQGFWVLGIQGSKASEAVMASRSIICLTAPLTHC